MLNFDYNIPTKIYFGKGQIEKLREIKKLGSRVLLVYGGGTIKKTGLYSKVTTMIDELGMIYMELPGVEPNPRIESVRKGIELCRENKLDVILAVGGGSVIDCSKLIASGTLYNGDPWELVLDVNKINSALPIASVLTLSATGSEMNGNAVITNFSENAKLNATADCHKPRFSILDPEYTTTVSKQMTAAGVADIISHTLESYFTPVAGGFLQARICEALLKTCIHYGPIAYNDPNNYEARANLMWASSLAINGLCNLGQQIGWTVHPLEHELSAHYDITHGVGLAILTPHWMRYVLNDKTVKKFVEFGENVWDIPKGGQPFETAKLSINKIEEFFRLLDIPTTLSELGIDDQKFEEMAKNCENRTMNGFVPISAEDSIAIYSAAL